MTIRDRLRFGAAGLATASVLAAALPGAASPQVALHRAAHPLDEHAIALIYRASREVEKHDPACRYPKVPQATFSHGSPSQALLSTFGVFRRPAMPADAFPDPLLLRTFPVQGIYVDYIRRARVALGRSFYVIPAANTNAYEPPPKRCFREQRRRLRRDVRGLPRALRHRALTLQARLIAVERRVPKPKEGVLLFDLSPDGGGGGGGDTVEDIDQGLSFNGDDLNRRSTLLSAIVPDGVASVTMRFGARSLMRGHRYRRRISVTASVEGNVLVAKVPRRGIDAFPSLVLWRAADGRVIKRFRLPH